MGPRITTWNVNGIRNPFGYQPWRSSRTFEAMFDILEADIVVIQECKIQKKDLRDDMVLIPGWDAFFSLPKHKKGYSGVAIYTRNSVCAPIRAEEGITGILSPPGSSTSYYDQPEDQQIGGYPSIVQLDSTLDAMTLDSEGRCLVLEFPAFVLIGTYCPANRDETRDEFRIGFLNAVDARIRNLVAMGKRVFWTGDLNIIREELDTASPEETMKKNGWTVQEFLSTPARRLFNQLLLGGKVFNEPDEGREKPVLWDICRGFHPQRKGMFTCWETKTNARPGNFGARIDYVLCSQNVKDWFSESDIQEGLLGSDHCPVYAVLKDEVEIDGKLIDVREVMNPPNMFLDGVRIRDWSQKDLLSLSAKLIPEFDRRRNIRDMFARKPTLAQAESSNLSVQDVPSDRDIQPNNGTSTAVCTGVVEANAEAQMPEATEIASSLVDEPVSHPSQVKRALDSPFIQPAKKAKVMAAKSSTKIKPGKVPFATGKGAAKGQSSLMGFFKSKAPDPSTEDSSPSQCDILEAIKHNSTSTATREPLTPERKLITNPSTQAISPLAPSSAKSYTSDNSKPFIDPIVAKESWGKLLSKRVAPRCEHEEPCISFLTKKPGINCGRSFYMCPRPLGPSGAKEKNTQWRCGTFIWSSDWTGGDGS